MTSYTKQELNLARVLNWLTVFAIVLSMITLIGAYFGPSGTFFIEPPLLSNTVAGLILMALLAWIASGDVHRFRIAIYVVILGLALAAISFLLYFLTPQGESQRLLALIGAIAAGAVAVLVGLNLSRARSDVKPWEPWQTDKQITGLERIGQVVFVLFGLISVIAAAGNLLMPFIGSAPTVAYFKTPIFVVGSVMKIGLLGVCSLIGARNIRRYGYMITLVILVLVASVIGAIVSLAGVTHFGADSLTIFGNTFSSQEIMVAAVLMDGIICVVFSLLKFAIDKSVLDYLSFFTPMEFRALEAISGILIGSDTDLKIQPYQIALHTDRYLGSFPSSRLWLAKLAVVGVNISPLVVGKPPVTLLRPEARRAFIDAFFKQEIISDKGMYRFLDRPVFSRLIDFIEGGMRFNMQLTYLGYYSDPTVHKSIGYVPFSERPKTFKTTPMRSHPPLKVMTPHDLRSNGIDEISSADVVIIGSGAAGATLAEQFANKGRDVFILEKGLYVQPDDFTEDEIEQIGHLYADGALQISQALRFTVLQGNCVGGSTVVNNAVCFDTPQTVMDKWSDPNGLNAGIDAAAFYEAQKAVRESLSIQSIKDSSHARPSSDVLNPGDRVLGKGIARYLEQGNYTYDVVNANITDCLGCGYCNIGCKYGRKLSMLDEVLPRAQKAHPDNFRVISEAQAVRLNGRGGKVTEIVVRMSDGRALSIRNPKTVVVSAGTIASSWLLMRSGIGKGVLPVGRHLCFNMGSPLYGVFEEKLDSYAGLQIAHFLQLKDHPGFIYETWYNPPVAQSLAMPGWLDTHFVNMNRYDHMAAVGVLVGTETNAYLTPALILRGTPDIVYNATEGDLDKLVDALTIMGHIMFEAGATEVFANTRNYQSYKQHLAHFRNKSDLDNLKKLVKDDRDILLGTGHPQGGNAISKTRGKDGMNGGVVGPDFKVYGYDNLYVCDASVHPSPTTVNPQLTIMTMARYAASLIH